MFRGNVTYHGLRGAPGLNDYTHSISKPEHRRFFGVHSESEDDDQGDSDSEDDGDSHELVGDLARLLKGTVPTKPDVFHTFEYVVPHGMDIGDLRSQVDRLVADVPAIKLFRDHSYHHGHDEELRALICALESKAGAFWKEAMQHSIDMTRLGAQLHDLQVGATEGSAVDTAERLRELEARNLELDRSLQAAKAEAAKCEASVS